jgi:uncharacterized protein YjbI with pentapeptide repeats
MKLQIISRQFARTGAPVGHETLTRKRPTLFEADIDPALDHAARQEALIAAAVSARVDLGFADLVGSRLVRLDCTNMRLARSDLSASSVSGVNFRCADLSDASLHGARVSFSDFGEARLDRADLVGSFFDHSNLSGANLMGARFSPYTFRRAHVAEANFRGSAVVAPLTHEPLTLVDRSPILRIGPIGSRMDNLTAFFTHRGVYLNTGCFFGTLEEFREALRVKHPTGVAASNYAAALALIEADVRSRNALSAIPSSKNVKGASTWFS